VRTSSPENLTKIDIASHISRQIAILYMVTVKPFWQVLSLAFTTKNLEDLEKLSSKGLVVVSIWEQYRLRESQGSLVWCYLPSRVSHLAFRLLEAVKKAKALLRRHN
jgi:hypothetical protein